MTTYIIVDGFGNTLGGTSSDEAEIERMAQTTANDLGESVYYTTRDESGEPVEVEPEPEPTKADVTSWEEVASYVSVYPSDDGEAACDVSVEIGEAGGRWFIRTHDDAGGSDAYGAESFDDREDAEIEAAAFASSMDEGGGALSADAWTERRDRDAADEDQDSDGDWCVYWETVLEDAGPRERYATREGAEAAARIADRGIKHYGNLLCGFSVRHTTDAGETWDREDEE